VPHECGAVWRAPTGFEAADADGDGVITQAEFHNWVEERRHILEQAEK
jgi:hypothetical protein